MTVAVEALRGRLAARRSILCCPANRAAMVAKAATSGADGVLLDLEDAVPAAEKAAARVSLATSLRQVDFGHRTVTVRINGLDTPLCDADLDVLRGDAAGQITAVCLPKVRSPDQVVALDARVRQIEREIGRQRPFLLELLVEDVRAVEHLFETARATTRVAALVFGPGDYGASQGVRTLPGADALPDPFLLARLWTLTAARSAGVQPVDGPSTDLAGGAALRGEAAAAAAAGFEAKWALHPAQIEAINMVFEPSPDEIEHARSVCHAAGMAAQGAGAMVHRGEFLDEATVTRAKALLARSARSQTFAPEAS